MLIAKKIENLLPITNYKKEINILISSLSLGGAEKIVVDFSHVALLKGYKVNLFVLHKQDKEFSITKGINVFKREKESITTFLNFHFSKFNDTLVTHLIPDNILSYIWNKFNLNTIPVIHNDKQGWKNDPLILNNNNVPHVIACADYVKKELLNKGLKKDIFVIKHYPLLSNEVYSMENRIKLRNDYNISKNTLFISCVGSIKKQKNYLRLIEIAKELKHKNKNFVIGIFGDYHNEEGKEIKNSLLKNIKDNNLNENFKFFGFQNNIEYFYPMFDVLLNISLYEGFSIATQEALLSDIPVVATNVSGQSEIDLEGLVLIEKDFKEKEVANILSEYNVRKEIKKIKKENNSMLWSLAGISEQLEEENILFITANLNAGGAQRSLVNLTKSISKVNKNNNCNIAVCNFSTNDYFFKELNDNQIDVCQLGEKNDVFEISFQLLNLIREKNFKNIVFWNVDPKVKLLVSKFIYSGQHLIDVSPGHYAFEEMEQTLDFQKTIRWYEKDFYNRLNKIVFKYDCDTKFLENKEIKTPTSVIRNGVLLEQINKSNFNKKIVVSGRLTQSKFTKEIIMAFRKFNIFKNYELHFYGQIEEKNANYIEDLNFISGKNVYFHGSSPDLEFLKEDYFCTIILGKHQGCPNTALEAASAYIPIIANDSGGTKEIVINGCSGILINENFNINDIVSALEEMEKIDKHSLCKNAQELIKNNFSIEKMVELYKKELNLI